MDNLDRQRYEAVRRRVMWKLAMRVSFVANLIFFFLTTAFLWQSAVTAHASPVRVLFFVLIWGTGLMFHATQAFNLFGWLADRLVQRELEREDAQEKPKHGAMRLGDDGELIEVTDDEEASSQKTKHR